MNAGYLTLGGLAAVTVLSWLTSEPTTDLSLANDLTQLLGGLALVAFACLMVMSTRIGVLDSLFGGLDKTYVAHKWLGVLAVGLSVAHLVAREPDEPGAVTQRLSHLGIPSLALFVGLVLLALVARRMKYEAWRTVHKFMIVPYGVGLVHYFGSSSYNPLGVAPFSLWLALVALVGVVAAIYSVFLYGRVGSPYTYRITDLRLVADRTIEVTGTAVSRPLPCRPGQFAFLKIPERRFGSHPFTISRAAEDELQFSIKALGDHTSQLVTGVQVGAVSGPADGVRVGDTMVLSRAHGRFDYTTGSRRQVWIAAGIGVTPFRSFLSAGVPADYTIDLFYAYRGKAEGAYLDELRGLAAPNVRMHFIDSLTGGKLTAERVSEVVSPGEPFDVYFCGPKPMREALKKGLRSSAVRRVHCEEFEFGR